MQFIRTFWVSKFWPGEPHVLVFLRRKPRLTAWLADLCSELGLSTSTTGRPLVLPPIEP